MSNSHRTNANRSDFLINDISKAFDARLIVQSLSVSIQRHSLVGFLGPNGCGKSTLLSLLAGTLAPDSGGCSYNGTPMAVGDSALIVQNYRDALFPWLSNLENVAYPLRLKGVPRGESLRIASLLFDEYDVPFSREMYPYQLSGGQQQLLSFLRGVAQSPRVLLMDEPFSALDYPSKVRLRESIERLLSKSVTTCILVSHDIDELLLLADRLIVFQGPPMCVIDDVSLDSPHPRDITFLEQPEIARMKRSCLEHIVAARGV